MDRGSIPPPVGDPATDGAAPAPAGSAAALLEVRGLAVRFRDPFGLDFLAVDRVSFDVRPGEVLAIIGESGSGKSVTALSLTRLLPTPPAEFEGGSIRWKGRELLALEDRELRTVRGGEIAYIFQEPGTSLNPVFTVRNQIGEAIRLHRPEVDDVDGEIVSWLERVGIDRARERLGAYPHELSGGMQQRVMIAMALACRPDLLVADEPTTALDVSIQRRIIELLDGLRREFGMAVLMITHNFAAVHGFADRVAVMYRGRIVEQGAVAEVLARPAHPYTRALIDCIPRIGQRRRRLAAIDHEALDRELAARSSDPLREGGA